MSCACTTELLGGIPNFESRQPPSLPLFFPSLLHFSPPLLPPLLLSPSPPLLLSPSPPSSFPEHTDEPPHPDEPMQWAVLCSTRAHRDAHLCFDGHAEPPVLWRRPERSLRASVVSRTEPPARRFFLFHKFIPVAHIVAYSWCRLAVAQSA